MSRFVNLIVYVKRAGSADMTIWRICLHAWHALARLNMMGTDQHDVHDASAVK